MNTFVSGLTKTNHEAAYTSAMTTTQNGALTYASSLNHNVDLFGIIGSARGRNLNSHFDLAFAEAPDIAIRMVQWVRDIRGGAGERLTYRNLLNYLETQSNYHSVLESLIKKTPEIGRWDDILIFKTPKFKNIAFSMIKENIGNGLLHKWLPREKSNRVEDRAIAKELMQFLGLTPRQYRKMLVDGTKVVENQMCAQQWDAIKFQAVPSVASRRYSKAFSKNATDAYIQYLKDVANGTAKINASAIFPYDITSIALQNGNFAQEMAAEAQWNSLPNYMNGKRILPIIDTSSSMNSTVPGTKFSHMHMAITIGMYVAEKNVGAFKNVFMTFNTSPSMAVIPSGTLKERYHAVRGASWGGSTNFIATFELILNHAIKNKVPKDEMPEIIICPSDMQFNQAGRLTNFQAVRNLYENAGYDLPKLVFWQMNGSMSGSPVRANQPGVALVSGFSPAIMQSVLGDEAIVEKEVVKESPEDIMIKTLMVDRYDWQ